MFLPRLTGSANCVRPCAWVDQAEGPPLVGAEEIQIIGTYSFQVLDETLYVLDLNSIGLHVVATYPLLGNGTTYYGMTSFNNRLYVSDPFYGIEIFDVSNPLNLVLLGSYETSCNDIKYFNDCPDDFV